MSHFWGASIARVIGSNVDLRAAFGWGLDIAPATEYFSILGCSAKVDDSTIHRAKQAIGFSSRFLSCISHPKLAVIIRNTDRESLLGNCWNYPNGKREDPE